MQIDDLVIDAYKTVGDNLTLTGIRPYYEYIDNVRTDTLLGYTYTVAMMDKGLDKIDVKIPGPLKLERDPNEPMPLVVFAGLTMRAYIFTDKDTKRQICRVSATAKDINFA